MHDAEHTPLPWHECNPENGGLRVTLLVDSKPNTSTALEPYVTPSHPPYYFPAELKTTRSFCTQSIHISHDLESESKA